MTVLPGIDVLLSQQLNLIARRRIGLISNASGVTRDLTSDIDALRQAPGVQLAALFGPEHGFYAGVPDGLKIGASVDARTGLPVHSLYGQTEKPTGEMLADLDVLVFDIQAMGVRFYTYITTLLYAMQAAAEHGLAVVVCDRPNPIGGEVVEGPLLEPGFESFIGSGPLPIRHGLTMGELARLYKEVWGVNCDLTVVPCQGWTRSMWYDETGLFWIPSSPGMPKLDSAIVYPGTCLIEGINLSEGRGTGTPFEVAGAPWIDAWELAETLNGLDLAGVKFRPTQFQPTDSKWRGQICAGVQFHVLDRRALRPVTIGLHLIATLKALYPTDFAWRLPHFDHLSGTDQVRQQLEAEVAVSEIVAGWASDQATFEAQRRQVMLY